MKLAKFLAIAFLITLGACDVTESRKEEAKTYTTNKVVMSSTIKASKTIFSTIDSNIIVGTILDKESSKGGNVIVCSDLMDNCAKTNSKGNYYIQKPLNTNILMAARSYDETDTSVTPENFTPTLPNDTTFDTTVISDTTVNSDTTGNVITDSVVITDSIVVTSNIVVVQSTPVTDTLTVVSNGTILREIPITSWGFILPPSYIVQRDISAKDSTFDGAIVNVEAVYFITGDSVAKVITLGRSGKFFSGFLYTYYDDSSYIKDTKIYNMFLRARDSNDNIICVTPIKAFSEKFGDFETEVFSKKVGIPESKIVPRIIPAAENNKTLSESINEYLSFRDTTINWININNSSVPYDTLIREFDSTEYTMYYFKRAANLNRVYDSVSVEILSDKDSVLFMYQDNPSKIYLVNVTKNVWSSVKIGLVENSNIQIYFKSSVAQYRNIRFYLK